MEKDNISKEFTKELRELYGGQRYHSISTWLKREFGSKTIKLAIDGGFTCPNRDGTKGMGGCIFCSDSGSGEFASDIDDQIRLLSDKWPDAGYLAYFQNHPNTSAPVSELRAKYYAVLANPKIKGLVIGTRPDCLSDDVLDLLAEINKTHFMWVELGLQPVHNETARLINRCYDLDVFDDAMARLASRGIRTVVPLILGLPGESREMMRASVRYVASAEGLFGMKLHQLYGGHWLTCLPAVRKARINGYCIISVVFQNKGAGKLCIVPCACIGIHIAFSSFSIKILSFKNFIDSRSSSPVDSFNRPEYDFHIRFAISMFLL